MRIMPILASDNVMVIPEDDDQYESFRGKIDWYALPGHDDWYVRTDDGELTGPWADGEIHADHPHTAGTLHDCPACEVIMDKQDDDDLECPGHESLAGEHMGESVYCDGSCAKGRK